MACLYFIVAGWRVDLGRERGVLRRDPARDDGGARLLNPSFNYVPRFNKPVLSYWIVAAFYKVFGVSVGVQRLPIALGALVIIGCAFILGQLAGFDRPRTEPPGERDVRPGILGRRRPGRRRRGW